MKRFATILLGVFVLTGIAAADTVLRQSTSKVVRIGPAVAVGDGFTPVTSLALGTADEAEALRAGTATLDISGATFAAITGADGWYDLTLDTTATNTVGDLTVVINDDSLILPLFARFTVVEESVYDNLYAGSAVGPLTAAQVNAEADTALADIHLDHLLAADYDPATPPGTATALLNELVESDGGVSRFTVNSLENAPSGSGASAEAIVDEWEAQSQADPTGFHVNVKEWNGDPVTTPLEDSDDIAAAVWADTTRTLTASTNFNDVSEAEVKAQVDQALVDIHLDHVFAVDYDPASKPGVATAWMNELVESDGGITRFTINALEQGPSGSGASAESIADAVWTEALADHSGTAGSTAEALDDATTGGGLDAAGVRAAVGLASANLDTQLSTIDSEVGVIDGIVDDVLLDTAEIANLNDFDPTTDEVDVGAINGCTITGDGGATPFNVTCP